MAVSYMQFSASAMQFSASAKIRLGAPAGAFSSLACDSGKSRLRMQTLVKTLLLACPTGQLPVY